MAMDEEDTMRLAITGHRPEKLGDLGATYMAISYTLQDLDPEYMYQGMAPGADLLSWYVAAILKIPTQSVLPYAGHRAMVKDEFWLNLWDLAYAKSDSVEVLSDSIVYPGHWCMFNRNHYMVDHADEVLAVWDGRFGRGGTQETVKYAISKGKPVHVIDPSTLEFTHADQTP